MPKILKTRAELTKLLLNEARQSGKCTGVELQAIASRLQSEFDLSAE